MASQTKKLAKVHGYQGRSHAWISRVNPCMDIEGEPVHGYQRRTRAWISKANPCMDIGGIPKFLGKWPCTCTKIAKLSCTNAAVILCNGYDTWPQKSEIGLRERSMDESTPGPVDESSASRSLATEDTRGLMILVAEAAKRIDQRPEAFTKTGE
ncbi:hypothetical protein C8R43DRAFT_949888 [Mycena crocata]|nr:hypothetical protein C8R43DRAFT_949888 [Mycena crocata]